MSVAIKHTALEADPNRNHTLFESFRQVDGNHTRCYSRSDLGFSLSRRIAALLDSDVQLESRLGSGSTFTFAAPHEAITPTSEKTTSNVEGYTTQGDMSQPMATSA